MQKRPKAFGRALDQQLATENIASVGGATFRQHGAHCIGIRAEIGRTDASMA